MAEQYNHEEQEMFAEARRLRKKAQDSRKRRTYEKENAYSIAAQKAADKKTKRDEEIRSFLLPLAKALVATGFRIKAEGLSGTNGVVFSLRQDNVYPSERVEIHWIENTGLPYKESGFSWN